MATATLDSLYASKLQYGNTNTRFAIHERGGFAIHEHAGFVVHEHAMEKQY